MRGIIIVVAALAPLLAVPNAAPAAGHLPLSGAWTWTYPTVSLADDTPMSGPGLHRQESGTLQVGPGAGQWTVELPSAVLGCDGGQPVYAPKASGTPLVTLTPDGTCRLFVYNDGQYGATWVMRERAGSTSAGPMRGQGTFR